ncbi:hypothetical protein [Maridesulfovibrio sp.]
MKPEQPEVQEQESELTVETESDALPRKDVAEIEQLSKKSVE